RRIARPRQAARRSQALDPEVAVPREDFASAVVVVLVDDEDAEVRFGLSVERLQEATELVDSADGRDDKIESHGPTLTPCRPSLLCCSPATTTPAFLPRQSTVSSDSHFAISS